MARLELAQLLRPNSTVEQAALIEHFYRTFDNRSAANRRIVNVDPLYFCGAIAGTEFLTYDATKLYLCYSFGAGGSSTINAAVANINFFDEANANSFGIHNYALGYDAATLYCLLPTYVNNIYFSRITIARYTVMLFNGFRITLV